MITALSTALAIAIVAIITLLIERDQVDSDLAMLDYLLEKDDIAYRARIECYKEQDELDEDEEDFSQGEPFNDYGDPFDYDFMTDEQCEYYCEQMEKYIESVEERRR